MLPRRKPAHTARMPMLQPAAPLYAQPSVVGGCPASIVFGRCSCAPAVELSVAAHRLWPGNPSYKEYVRSVRKHTPVASKLRNRAAQQRMDGPPDKQR